MAKKMLLWGGEEGNREEGMGNGELGIGNGEWGIVGGDCYRTI